MNFNYEKAYCVNALPSFQNLPYEVLNVHSKLIPLVGELSQNRNLNIPMTDAIRELIESLETKQIAELSRASYFVGHWKPSLLSSPFENKRGESWKISNCCDQVLRNRLELPYNLQVHEGILRVTFSNRDCWLWEEFALATEENLQTFKTCNLPFGENSLKKSAQKLAEIIGDLWPDVETIPGNDLYLELLELKKEATEKKLKQQFQDKIERLKQQQIDAQEEINALLWLNEHGYMNLDNVIYYSHTKRFCFGWREKLSEQEKSYLCELLTEFPFDYDFK